MTKSIRVTEISDVPAGTGREYVVAGRVVAIFQVEDEFYATDGLCPHAGGPIGTGTLRGCTVTCPWHGWQFDVKSGVSRLTDKIRLATYPVVQKEGALWLEVPDDWCETQ